MAYTDYTRAERFAQKRAPSVAVANIKEAAVPNVAKGTVSLVSGNELIVRIPARSLITNAYVQVTNTSIATTAVATLGTSEGGSQILSAVNLKTIGKQGTFTGQLYTGTGVDLYLGRTITGGTTAASEYSVVVEYLELDKVNGEYTKVNNV